MHRAVSNSLAPRRCVWIAASLAATLLASGCVLPRMRYDDTGRKGGNPYVRLPAACTASAVHKGFAPASPGELAEPRGVWWCARVLNMPGGRMWAAMGWYHEWIFTPDRECGADLEGADSIAGTWPESWKSFFRPMVVSQHKGSAAKPGTLAKRIRGIDYEKLQGRLEPGTRAGTIFPITNCAKWAKKSLKDCQLTPEGMRGDPPPPDTRAYREVAR